MLKPFLISKRILASTITVVVIVASALGVAVIRSANIGDQTNATNSLLGDLQCETNFPTGMTLTSGVSSPFATHNQTRTVFVMQTGSTAEICVTYKMLGQFNSTNGTPPTPAFAISVQKVVAIPHFDASGVQHGFDYKFASVPGISSTSTPLQPVFSGGSSGSWKVTVVYSITNSGSSTGFFDLEFTNQCPALIPFAVVSGSLPVSASDFQGFFLPGSCPLFETGLSLGTVTGTSNVETVEITN